MAYPDSGISTKWTFNYLSSSAGTDVQEFTVNYFRKAPTGPITDLEADLQAVADACVAAWATGADAMPEGWFPPSLTASHVTAYGMDTTWHSVTSASSAFTGGEAWHGTGSAGLPPQNALAVTMYHDDPTHYVPHRARRRGRFYLPVLDASLLAPDGTVTSGHVTGILAQVAGIFLTSIAPVLSDGSQPKYMTVSRVDEAFYETAWLGLGELVDTQRRRRNKLSENYQVIAAA